MDALTIQEAAETTDWSPRMLRYIEHAGLIEPQRSEAGYRLYGPAELQRLRTLRELVTRFDIGLGDVGFAQRLRRDDELATRSTPGSKRSPGVPSTSPRPTGCAGSRTSTQSSWPWPERTSRRNRPPPTPDLTSEETPST